MKGRKNSLWTFDVISNWIFTGNTVIKMKRSTGAHFTWEFSLSIYLNEVTSASYTSFTFASRSLLQNDDLPRLCD